MCGLQRVSSIWWIISIEKKCRTVTRTIWYPRTMKISIICSRLCLSVIVERARRVSFRDFDLVHLSKDMETQLAWTFPWKLYWSTTRRLRYVYLLRDQTKRWQFFNLFYTFTNITYKLFVYKSLKDSIFFSS